MNIPFANTILSRIIRWQLDARGPAVLNTDLAVKHVGFGLEEGAEQLAALGLDNEAASVDAIAKHLKTRGIEAVDFIVTNEQRREIIDGACDEIVYAIGKMLVCGADPLRALSEVADSNDSKRLADGTFMRDDHNKIIKPAHFVKPDLSKALIDDKRYDPTWVVNGLTDGT